MAKYIDADLLRKEIEFSKSVYDNPQRVVVGVADAFRQDGRAAMCDDILKKIDSLQQEEPLPNDLEEAANNYLDGVYGKMPHSDLHIAIFIAGAKGQYQKDREEFAQIKAKTWCEGFDACKEQMMKGALNGWLDEDNEPPYDLNVVCEEKIPFGEFKHSDKVRIIIIKEN